MRLVDMTEDQLKTAIYRSGSLAVLIGMLAHSIASVFVVLFVVLVLRGG